MSSEKEKENPGHVTQRSCQARHQKIDLALFGKDGRGGIVKDITEIKAATRARARAVEIIIVPVLVAVASAVITLLLLNGL